MTKEAEARRPALPAWRVVASRPEVQVDAAALELELIVMLGRAARRRPEQRCCFKDGVYYLAGSVSEKHRRTGEP